MATPTRSASSGGMATVHPEPERAGQTSLESDEQPPKTQPKTVAAVVGSLGVEVLAVVCSADRGSTPWLRYMDRVVNQPHDDGRALPECAISVLMSAGSEHGTPRSQRVVHQRTSSGILQRWEQSSVVMLSWPEEVFFDLSVSVFDRSEQRGQ